MTYSGDNIRHVTLNRADSGIDLWAAIETAQYGHVLQRDAPDAEESAAERDFAAAFTDIVEAWETTGAEQQSALILQLDTHIAALEQAGLYVHWCAIQHTMTDDEGNPVDLPIAIVRIGSHSDNEIDIALTTSAEDDSSS